MSRHLAFLFSMLLTLALTARGGTATSITGLYYTGAYNNSGWLVAGGEADPHWDVTYASIGGVSRPSYTGSAYVVGNTDPGWTDNNSRAKWITAPGGYNLPGNGTTGNNVAVFDYSLSFTVKGTGGNGEAVGNRVSISLSLAADDQYSVYLNPVFNADGSINKSLSASLASRTNAWTAASPLYLQNFSDANGAANANFVVGTNRLVIQVTNTNSITGSSSSTALNPSGLIVYQLGTAVVIDPRPVPEVGTWLPIAAAFGLYGFTRWRRGCRRTSAA